MENHMSNPSDSSDDEIENSQPISLPSSNSSDSQEVSLREQNRPPKNTGQNGNFRSIEEIDPKYRHIFTYPYFNLVQSSVIDDALYTDKSMVVCAPTGSGKTVIFEMSIIHLLMELDDKNYTDDFKIIYMAPVKALCTERLTEWYPKFNKLGILCIEVTGDTDVDFSQLKPYRIIITTPEKWDMLTRRWQDHRSLVEVIKLFLIDEVHILNDELRGPVLEAVVSRMKTIESSVQSAYRIEKLKAQYQGTSPKNSVQEAKIRFIAVSATVSNPEDVAAWLGTPKQPAVYHKFTDDWRPVKLRRVVEGYPSAVGASIFKFDIVLNYKLWPIIQKYHNGKPTLIFCNTRKSVVLTAETLSKEISVNFNAEQRMRLTALASTIKTKKIQSLILSGVGCHHAGLLFEERINIERAFRDRDLPILITTTTLAMGVNLPAHLVIIKNTQQYVNGAYQEYSMSTILQMVGRAGRPQYDTEATAVIMTRLQDKAKYEALVGGSEPLQSYLHKRLAENLNSEAALGTVGDIAQCVQWLNSTFLSVRSARDPKRYLGLPHGAPAHQISKKIEELCVKAVNGLTSAGLITMDEASCIESTEAGRLMSIYYLDLVTMKLIMKLEGSESLEQLLWLVCESHELSDMHLRVDERRILNALNRNNHTATIRFPMKGKIQSRQMKLNCIIQAVLGFLPISDPSLNQEAMKIMRIADRVCKCLVSYVTRSNFISQNPKFYAAILNSIILNKCISANLWENSPYVSRQLKGIGSTFSTLLASAGKVNFMLLEESHPRDLERIMNKGPPAGNVIRKQISLLPKYNLTATPIDESTVEIKLLLVNQTYLAENMDHLTAGIGHKSYVIVGDSENYLLYFTHFKESELINVYDGCMTFRINRKHNIEHKIVINCISSSFVGIDEQCQYLFKDINPARSGNISSLSPIEQPANIFKERKRKSQNEITHSKEKIKRDKQLIATFKSLKESFNKTSEEIKMNLKKTEEMSNRLLQNLQETIPSHDKVHHTPEHTSPILNDDYFHDAFQEEVVVDNSVDDKQFNDILNRIENEMKLKNNITTGTMSDEARLQSQKVKNCVKYPNISNKLSKFQCNSQKRWKKNKRNNYDFIDKIERDSIRDEEMDTPEIIVESGLDDAVKRNLEQFMERVSKSYTNKTNITDLVEPIVSDRLETATEASSKEEDITNMENYKNDNKELLLQISKQKNEPDSFNKGKIALEYQSFRSKENISNEGTFLTINNTCVKDFNDVVSNNAIQINNKSESKEIVPIDYYEKNNKNINSVTKANDLNDNYKLLMNLPKNNEIQLHNIAPKNTIPLSYCGNDLQDSQKSVPQSSFNSIENFISLPRDNCLIKSYTGNDAKDINFISNTKNRKVIENTKRYSFSKTNYFETTIENTLKQNVHLIGKMAINLDVTEIVRSSDHKSEATTKQWTVDVKDSEIAPLRTVNKDISLTNDTLNVLLKQNDNISEEHIISKKNSKICTESEVEDTKLIMKSDPSIKDILQKYNHILKGHENIYTKEEKRSNENNKEKKSLGTDIKPNRRKYRISDFDKIQVDLPKSIIGKNQGNTTFKTQDNISKKLSLSSNEVRNIDNNLKSSICNVEELLFSSSSSEPAISPEFVVEELTESNSDLDVSEAILNPKTLLQCISKDDELIIPPPPQFCDNDISPTSSLDTYKNSLDYDILQFQDNTFAKEVEDNIFENHKIDLTPSEQVEMCTKTSFEPCDLVLSAATSYTMMRKNLIKNQSKLNSRGAKLSEFKFKRKSIFRK